VWSNDECVLFILVKQSNPTVVLPQIRKMEFASSGHEFHSGELPHIFRAFPNVEYLKLLDISVDRRFDFSEVQPPLKLKRLHLHMTYRFSKELATRDLILRVLEGLLQINLVGLEEFSLENWFPEIDPNLLRTFILSQGSTLKKLVLKQVGVDTPPYFIQVFPLNLPFLEELTLHKAYIKHVRDLANLENLKSFSVTLEQTSNWGRIFARADERNDSVQVLTMDWVDKTSFRVLALTFSNLRVLRLNKCKDELLLIIFTELRELTSLTCLDEGIFDITAPVLVGLSDENLTDLYSRSQKRPKLMTSAMRGSPHIGVMKS